MKPIAITATTLTPFCYHSLMIYGGTATLPELISDNAISFGLAATLGMTAARLALPSKDYKGHLLAMPYRSSVFLTDNPELLPPLVRRCNFDGEGGFQKNLYTTTQKANLKDFFITQEVPQGKVFKGALFGFDGFDPFKYTKEEELVIRIGLHRNGMVLLKRAKKEDNIHNVRLNASTAALFDQELPMERYCLHGIQLTPFYEISDAGKEASQWK